MTASEVIPSPRLSVRYVTDALLSPPPEPPVLVEGMIRAGELCVIGAPRAIGKSWFAANLAALLSHGDGFLCGALHIARRAKVLIAQGEVDQWESSRRWAMLTGSGEPPVLAAETFDRWRIRVVRRRSSSSGTIDGSHFSDSDEWIDASLDQRLEATIAEHGFEVLIVDPWAVYYNGAENSNDEVEAALDKLRDLAMRYSLAVVLLHHLGKATDAREAEDLWRGASRLADWASTRVTILPHWTERQAADQGMTREQARRYVDFRFLRRSTPTPDFSAVLDPETGWWNRWAAPSGPVDARRVHLDLADVVDACKAAGGSWPSMNKAAEDLGIAHQTATKLIESAIRFGELETFDGPRGAKGIRLPHPRLRVLRDPEVDQ